ncbi:MAG: hypothetical protein STSR0008_16900 [Ignavibacterium sp.]
MPDSNLEMKCSKVTIKKLTDNKIIGISKKILIFFSLFKEIIFVGKEKEISVKK